ncbi:MAG: hypothetical protein WCL50_14975 [Spirochaetota bacterium]
MKLRNPLRLDKLDPILERQVLTGLRSAAWIFFLVYLVSLIAWTALWLLPSGSKSHFARMNVRYNFGFGENFLVVAWFCEAAYLW